MEHYDEEILKARKKAEDAQKARYSSKTVEREKQQSIYNDFVEIFKIPTKFANTEVLNGKAAIFMPVDFELRPSEEVKMLFPFGNPPQELYGNSYSYFIIALNWTEHQIMEDEIPEFIIFAKQLMERMGPRARVMKTDVKKHDKGNIGVMEVVANALQGVSYSYIFYTIGAGRLLIGTVMFDKKYKERLLPLAEEIVESFHIFKEGTPE
ncbi:MAG: hypothetical protein ACLUDG_00025 [Butyricicoccus sp.]